MSKANSNKKPVGDTPRRKSDALRAEDIMPPYGAGSKKRKTSRKNTSASENKRKRSSPDSEKGAVPAENVPTEQVEEQTRSEIPRFDLAGEIMAEHRKVASAKRKAPGKKTVAPRQERQVESVGHTIEQPTPALSEGQQIIAEIVARDIEELCRGNA